MPSKYIKRTTTVIDNYKIQEQLEHLMKIIAGSHEAYETTIQDDIDKFIGKTGHLHNKDASVRARNKLNDARILCESLRASILKQRQDNEANYERK